MRGHLVRRTDPDRGTRMVIVFADGHERDATAADLAGLRADAVNQATLEKKRQTMPDPGAGVEDPNRARALRMGGPEPSLGPSETVRPEETTADSTLSFYEKGAFQLLRDKSRFKQFMKDRVYRIADIDGYGGFAFKRTENSPIEFVNPETASDSTMMSLVADFLAPALSQHGGAAVGAGLGGFLGGPPGAVVGGVLGGALGEGGLEAARQGVTGEFDPAALTTEAVSGGLMFPEMKGAKAIGQGLSKFVDEGATSLAARVAGVEGPPAVRDAAFLARLKRPILQAMPTPQKAMKALQDALGALTKKGFRFPEKVQADAILSNIQGPVDMSPVESYLRNWLTSQKAAKGKAVLMTDLDDQVRRKIAADPTLPGNVKDVLNQIRGYTKGTRMDQLSPEQADGVLEILSDLARKEGVFGKHNIPITDEFKTVIRDARQTARASIESVAGPQWGQLNKDVSQKLDHLHEVRKSSGFNEPNLQTRNKRMERWVSNLYGDNTADSTLASLEEIERYSGVDLSALKESAVGRAVGSSSRGYGVPTILPKITATGGILGSSLLGGVIGYQQGGAEGVAIGSALGAGLAMPRNVYRLARAAVGPWGSGARRVGSFLVEEAARVGAVQANRTMIPAATSVVTSDDERLKRRGPTIIE